MQALPSPQMWCVTLGSHNSVHLENRKIYQKLEKIDIVTIEC